MIPFLGTFSTQMYTLGDKYKGVIDVKGETAITWSDGVTNWDYDASKNELTIKNAKRSDAEGSMSALNGITEGYDVKLKKETDEAWYFVCTKLKTNTKKDDPSLTCGICAVASLLCTSLPRLRRGFAIRHQKSAIE